MADVADEIGMKYFMSRDLKVDTKPDDSPVTQGDTEIEAALSRIAIEEFGDSYVGEEGTSSGESDRRWLVDPIDCTKNFLRGFPVWGSLISLKEGDEVVVATVSAPALGRRWWATKDGGAFTRDVNGQQRRIHTSGVKDLSDAFVLHGTFNSLEQVEVDPELVFRMIRSAWRHRSPGDFLGHMLIAEGAADGFVDVPSALWDIEASTLIVREAGGSMRLMPEDEDEIKLQRLAISSNGLIEKHILEQLRLK